MTCAQNVTKTKRRSPGKVFEELILRKSATVGRSSLVFYFVFCTSEPITYKQTNFASVNFAFYATSPNTSL